MARRAAPVGAARSDAGLAPGIASPEERVCVLCGRATVYKCAMCLLTRYCSSDCQKADWSIHKESCQPPEPHFGLCSAIALPDYNCFWVYQAWATSQDNPGVGISYAVVSQEMFLDMFGQEELAKTCLTLAITGRPKYVAMACLQ